MHIYQGNSKGSIELHTAAVTRALRIARERVAVIPEELTLNSRRRSMCGTWSLPHTPLSHSNYELTGATTPAKNGCQGLRSISNEDLGQTIR